MVAVWALLPALRLLLVATSGEASASALLYWWAVLVLALVAPLF